MAELDQPPHDCGAAAVSDTAANNGKASFRVAILILIGVCWMKGLVEAFVEDHFIY